MITRRTFIRSSALVAATLVLGGAAGGLAGCAADPNVLRVGTKIDVPGFGFQNPETGNIEGMEVDIARELAKRIKGSPDALKVTGVNVTTRGAMLDNGTLDATLATFTITEARKKSYNFSRPYYTDHIGVLVKKSSGIVDLKDLDGKTVGVALSAWWAPAIGTAASAVGDFVKWATVLQPFWMGILVSVVIGVALTLPISSAAICAAIGLTGLAGGAAVAGCCANMVGFAVLSFRENRWGGLVSQGIGTSMLQMPNIVKNPRIWLPAILTSAVTGPLATCFFKLEMNGDPINSGMGTCGLCGQLGVWTGWVNPSDAALANGAAAMAPTAFDWVGLILISFVLPAVLTWAFGLFFRKIGWIKPGDLTLPQ